MDVGKISIIIPVFNGEKYIMPCVESIENQSCENLEVIFIDDGSTDRTAQLLLGLAREKVYTKVISQENQGVIVARERGIQSATGEFVVFLDVDDTLITGALLEMVQCMNAFPMVDIVVTGFNIVRNEKIISSRIPSFDVLNASDHLRFVLSGRDGWELWGKMYRRKLFDLPLKKPQKIRVGEDAAMYIQLVCRAKIIAACRKPFYNYIQYNNSVSHTRSQKHAEETLEAACFIEQYLKDNGHGKDLKSEIDCMFLLFYSNSTRRAALGRRHPLVRYIRDNHWNLNAFLRISHIKSVYILMSYYTGIGLYQVR